MSRSDVTRIGGGHPDHPSVYTILPNGQQEDYLILKDRRERIPAAHALEKRKASGHTERRQGRHGTLQASMTHTCGTETQIIKEIAVTFAREPKFYEKMYCRGGPDCKPGMYPVGEFRWPNGKKVGTEHGS